MRKIYRRLIKGGIILLSLILVAAALLWWYISMWVQEADPDFDATVSNPAYQAEHPRVLFDEAHFNFHTTEGIYNPFVKLLRNDGYLIVPNTERFQADLLEEYDVLVISNARGSNQSGTRDRPAFTEAECDAVYKWVQDGGALLLIADHAPYGAAADILSKEFGVEMSNCDTVDPLNHYEMTGFEDFSEGLLIFSRENGLLGNHPITQGRNTEETINRVLSFNGQSLKGPEDCTTLLTLSNTAIDIYADGSRISAAGRTQGIAMRVGSGRTVILGEAAMLTAQIARVPFRKKMRGGISQTDIDNKQLVLNIMHWLSGLLD
ncbi:MAG: hypothetical protein KAV87_10480 [Desulfobacteraceae bacterium]|nr:hypothetical protein [Desulfobacteraceae bacterium]